MRLIQLLTAIVGVGMMAAGIVLDLPAPDPAKPHAVAIPHGPVTAIVNVRVFDGERLLPRATVVIAGDRIGGVGPDLAVPAGAKVVDGTGRTLLPGLIDSHTHASGDALERALRFGVTTELDMFADPSWA